jgi:diguanylate cyclase (GGDEF)-like protein
MELIINTFFYTRPMADDPTPRADMSLYDRLSRTLPFGYKGKFLSVAFVGTHIPLLGMLVLLLVFLDVPTATMVTVLGVALGATLLGTAATLWTLDGLLAPVENTGRALRGYIEQGLEPDLPTHYEDDAGELMADAQAALKHLDGVIDELVHFDSVTRLPNRRVFLRQLAALLDSTETEHVLVVALQVTNLDDIQLSLGADASEDLLRVLANRFDVDPVDANVAGRLGDAEFVAAVRISDPSEVEATVNRWSDALEDAFETRNADRTVYPDFEIGYAVYPNEEADPEELVRAAAARIRTGAPDERTTSASPLETIEQNFQMSQALRHAADRGELSLAFQPIVDVETGEMTSAEALLRWSHPELGDVSPGVFIPLAERTGLITELGIWVLQEACSQAVTWREQSDRDVQITVNVSPVQLLETKLPEQVESILRDTGLQPSALVLEITELASLGDLHNARHVVERLQGLGVSIALDDFGTGHASMQYLAEWDVDKIKIDRSFVDRVAETPIQQRICRGVVALGESIDAEIICEGVEQQEDLSYLKTLGCRAFQGYLLQRPCGADELESFNRSQTGSPVHG